MSERCGVCKERLLWSDTKQRFIHYGAWHDKKKYDHPVVRDIGHDAPISAMHGWVWQFPDGRFASDFVSLSDHGPHDGMPLARPHSSGGWVRARLTVLS